MPSTQLKQVIFISQEQAEEMNPPFATALVSITDPMRAHAAIKEGWQAVLRVAFHDKDPVNYPEIYEDLQEITQEQAEKIAAFVKAQAQCSQLIVVHCRAGISRSAGAAKAIAEYAGIFFPDDYVDYNDYVFQVMQRALNKKP